MSYSNQQAGSQLTTRFQFTTPCIKTADSEELEIHFFFLFRPIAFVKCVFSISYMSRVPRQPAWRGGFRGTTGSPAPHSSDCLWGSGAPKHSETKELDAAEKAVIVHSLLPTAPPLYASSLCLSPPPRPYVAHRRGPFQPEGKWEIK